VREKASGGPYLRVGNPSICGTLGESHGQIATLFYSFAKNAAMYALRKYQIADIMPKKKMGFAKKH
jgi:hypothetical protein